MHSFKPFEMKSSRRGRVERLSKLLVMMAYDMLAIHAAYFVALLGRFDFQFSQIPEPYLTSYLRFITPFSVVCLLAFLLFRLYWTVWRYASYSELLVLLEASLCVSLLHAAFITLFVQRMPMTYYIWGAILQAILLAAGRFFLRFMTYVRGKNRKFGEDAHRVMLIGAGSAAQMILKDIQHGDSCDDHVVCIIDDDSAKWNLYLDGVRIVGGRESILENVERFHIDKIYFAIPTASPSDKQEILNICSETNCELRQLPGVRQIIDGHVTVGDLRTVSVEDLLGRAPIETDMTEVYRFIHGKTVLVTGGGGSIGSELCRQIAAHDPKQLILLDIYENNAYDVQLELQEKYPDLDLKVLIGSVRDSRRMFQIFADYRPQIVYHAAAHKHVPLMEVSPCEALKNNPIGTYKTAYAAMIHGCERFVLISSDKAVNPTNVMGASKRLCEMIVQSFDRKIREGRADEIPQLFTHMGVENADRVGDGEIFRQVKTQFVAVRFGNVLGSNGSVVPIFKKQIEKGGPVTVTHPDIIRYFMTVQEAVSLVMLAGTFAHDGEIFVLDMGSPVKIDTLARNLIRLAGLRPDEDIRIEYTGLRPGEKLYEEKLMAEEGLRKTSNQLIHIGRPIPFEVDTFLGQLRDLMDAAYSNRADVRDLLQEVVTTYHPIPVTPSPVTEDTQIYKAKQKEKDAVLV